MALICYATTPKAKKNAVAAECGTIWSGKSDVTLRFSDFS
uniref:Uncharacterized protein n=1 Tax=uncultured bacterium pAW1 TaxID=1781155 RepID=A0A1C9U4Q0_9BACT|nr:hypothetical protein [uncultured bacterium pAW1]